ncbi:MAG: ribonuclease H-like domain-containing protein [Syntrophales bacterium]|jgi:uncharacterized protein YprB with RNaseH-like and TPR domain
MNTLSRLKRLTAGKSELADTRSQSTLKNTINDLSGAREVGNAFGNHLLVSTSFPHLFHHGNHILADALQADMNLLALLAKAPELASLSCGNALFLDTETTGLTGGTGTFVFLIGLGWFEKDCFMVHQIFARDFSEERSGLASLQDMLYGKDFLVTFNGKAFDVNLLTTRFILNRFENSLTKIPHLDLLYPARSLLKHRLEDRRLGNIEQNILGFQRRGDIPGFEIPQRYFNWLRQRDASSMEDVLEHNRLDILTLAVLVSYFSSMLSGSYEVLTSLDRLVAGYFCLLRGAGKHAESLLKPLLESGRREIMKEAGFHLSLLYKRQNRWYEAVDIWKRMVVDEPGNVFARVELAKWYEHRIGDVQKAKLQVESTLNMSNTIGGKEKEALFHRLERLNHKILNHTC